MSDLAEDFDPSPFVERESEVLAVFAQHIAALSPQQLHRLQDEGAVLMDLHALEAGDHFELRDLAVAFVKPEESVADVESRLGKVWISSFTWLKDEDRGNAAHELLWGDLCHRDILIQTMSFNWFELVLWALEERWLNDSG
jgi:hypothetical protein